MWHQISYKFVGVHDVTYKTFTYVDLQLVIEKIEKESCNLTIVHKLFCLFDLVNGKVPDHKDLQISDYHQ